MFSASIQHKTVKKNCERQVFENKLCYRQSNNKENNKKDFLNVRFRWEGEQYCFEAFKKKNYVLCIQYSYECHCDNVKGVDPLQTCFVPLGSKDQNKNISFRIFKLYSHHGFVSNLETGSVSNRWLNPAQCCS